MSALAPEPVLQIGKLAITNTYINSTIAVVVLVVTAFFIRASLKKVPGRLQSAVEILIEGMLDMFDQVTGSRERSKKFLPLVGSLFLFILLSNWMGLLPGTGTIGIIGRGEHGLISFLRPATSDLNLTLALALISVLFSHALGIVTLGFFTHANKFIQLGTLWKALTSLNPIKILVALVEMVVGVIEIFSEIAKVVSLSLRLFGNVFAGEILITVISGLIAYVIPIPFIFLEIIVGIVQASVFALLTLVYLTVASDIPHAEEEASAH
ncbi:MAG: F0F1 ATP synthase subunit A [bacterium]|nr:F0F1 ATP synthase subunit A [bacterium]